MFWGLCPQPPWATDERWGGGTSMVMVCRAPRLSGATDEKKVCYCAYAAWDMTLQSVGGQYETQARPMRESTGTNQPKCESELLGRLSPNTKYCPSGTRMGCPLPG